MTNFYNFRYLLCVFLVSIGILSCHFATAATVEFPSPTQPGAATLEVNENYFIFSNALFSASFVQENGKLYFGGSSQMSLAAGTELFEIVLGNGTKVKASEMMLVTAPAIVPATIGTTARYSEQLVGKMLTAAFKYNAMNEAQVI